MPTKEINHKWLIHAIFLLISKGENREFSEIQFYGKKFVNLSNFFAF